MNRMYYKCEMCGFDDSMKMSGSLGVWDKKTFMYCNCRPQLKLEPYAGKDTSQ